MLVLVVAALVVVAFSIGRASPSATSHSGAAQLRTVVVQPGDTLWAIATRSSPGADPRQTVQRIVDLNGLRGTSVVPGQQLRLPVAR
jgi:LysM repeat protein